MAILTNFWPIETYWVSNCMYSNRGIQLSHQMSHLNVTRTIPSTPKKTMNWPIWSISGLE